MDFSCGPLRFLHPEICRMPYPSFNPEGAIQSLLNVMILPAVSWWSFISKNTIPGILLRVFCRSMNTQNGR